jgi:hypothetical protein
MEWRFPTKSINIAMNDGRGFPPQYDLEAFAQQFAWNDHRTRLLSGLVAFRSRLEASGMVSFYHVVGGSFLRSKDEPVDIDMFTVVEPPFDIDDPAARTAFEAAYPDLMCAKTLKLRYNIDSNVLDGRYEMFLSLPAILHLSFLLSHDRDGVWHPLAIVR